MAMHRVQWSPRLIWDIKPIRPTSTIHHHAEIIGIGIEIEIGIEAGIGIEIEKEIGITASPVTATRANPG